MISKSICFPPNDLDLIREAAQFASSTTAGFIRIASVREARKILQEKKLQEVSALS